jgi:choline-sulfatase
MAIKEFAQPERAKRTIERGSTEIATLDKALEIPRGISREEFIEKYCPELPPNFEPQENEPEIFLDFRMRRPFKQKAFENWSKEEWRFHRMAYCRLTELVDAQIGKLINALKESGQEDDTVVIFTSDHGDMDSAHRLEHKTYFYEEASRIPLLIARPGEIQPGSVSSALVSNGLDLMPTLCDYAGIPAPKYASGYSFRPLAENKKTKTRDYVFAESEIGNMARTEYYKYILYDSGKNREQLYDMRKDPFETRNAARDNGNEDILEEHRLIMKKELERQKKLIPESGRKDYYNLNA